MRSEVVALGETTQELGLQDAWLSVHGVKVTANTPITNTQQIYFQFYMTQAILNEWPETRGKLRLEALLPWRMGDCAQHGRANTSVSWKESGQTRLSRCFWAGASFPPDSSEPSVITLRMTLWSAPTQTGGEVRAIAQTFMVGFGQGRKPSFPCERRVVRVGREGREGRPGCPRLSSSWILTFSSLKASCFERLFQNTHPLGVSMALVCVFLQKDLSGSTGAGVLLQRLTGTLKHAEDVGLWVIEFGREESL